jgi:hypothetical protein
LDERSSARRWRSGCCWQHRGAAYGLCIAYCEANDCEIQPDKTACDRLRENYAKLTGEDLFPCDGGGPEIIQ